MKKLQLNLYKSIYKIRQTEKKIAEHYSEQEMRCPVHLSIGQEAVAAGVCETLKKKDKILSGHRCHAHYLAKGGNLKAMIAEIYGKKTGCVKGLGGSMHLQDQSVGFIMSIPIVGSSIPISAGVALKAKSKMSKEEFVTVVFFGEGATEEGIFHETVNFAAVNNLPILFVCENNLYSVYTPLKDRQPKDRNLVKIVKSHGIKAISADGNDVLKVYNLAKKSINQIRQNNKPIFLEFKTYRWLEHVGPFWDDHLGYRKKDELKYWIKKCPLKNIRKKIIRHVSKKKLNIVEKKIDNEIDKAFIFAKKSKFPSKKLLNKFKYF